MSTAAIGGLTATVMIVTINALLHRDFAREWSEGLRAKHREPLGEIELARMLADKRDAEADDES